MTVGEFVRSSDRMAFAHRPCGRLWSSSFSHSRSFFVEHVDVVADAVLVEQLVELFVVDAVGALDLAVQTRRPRTDEDMLDVEVPDVPAELRLKLVAVVGLYDVHAERQQFTAIDDCTRIRVLESYDACNQATAVNLVGASGRSASWSQE